MENQTNNQMNPKIEANGGKSKKKKGKVFIIIIVLMFLMMSCVLIIGSEDTSTTTTTKETESEQEIEQTEDKIEEEKPEAKTKDTEDKPDKQTDVSKETQTTDIVVGAVLNYETGTITVLGAEIAQGIENNPMVRIEIEIENTSDDVIAVTNSDFSMYIDDYQVDITIGYRDVEEMSSSSVAEVNPGRKMKYTFRAVLPNGYENASNIEIGFPGYPDSTLFIKKNGEYLYGQQSTNNSDIGDIGNTGAGGLDESMYGDHQSLDGLSYVLNFEPIDNGNGADALVTIKDGNNNYQCVMYMEDERTGYLSYMEEYVEVGVIYFSMDGIEVESKEHPEFNGLYW